VSQSSSSPQASQQSLLQQAPVVPLDASGFTAAVVGTILAALAAGICWICEFTGRWVQIIDTGVGIGIVLIAVTAWHRWGKRTSRKN